MKRALAGIGLALGMAWVGAAAAGGPKVVVCHRGGHDAHLIEIAASALASHLAHGDYVARFAVDPGSPDVGNGIDFARITDALAVAREGRLARDELVAAACPITILVAPGRFRGTFDAPGGPSLERFPLFIDVPQISLRGGLQMVADADGRATGASADEATVTTLLPDRPLRDGPPAEGMIVVVGHPDGSRGDGTVIEGFAFQSGHDGVDRQFGGAAIYALRVVDLVVRGNRFEPTLTTGFVAVATSARVERNHAYRLGANCTICISGPGAYEVVDNRLLQGALGGIYVAAVGDVTVSLGAQPVAAAEPYVAAAPPAVRATIGNNDVRDHVAQPIGFGIRVLATGSVPLAMPQSNEVTLRDNDFVHNTFGVIVDAGFPVAGSPWGGRVDVTAERNDVAASCQSELLVAFTRHRAALGLGNNPYVHNSTYRLDLGGDVPWSAAWYSHPPGFGNALVVDGTAIANGAYVGYDPTRACGL